MKKIGMQNAVWYHAIMLAVIGRPTPSSFWLRGAYARDDLVRFFRSGGRHGRERRNENVHLLCTRHYNRCSVDMITPGPHAAC